MIQEIEMGGVPQSQLSRRKLMAVALAAPVAGRSARNSSAIAASSSALLDPLVAKAAAWGAANSRLEAMDVEADELEGQVFEKAKALRIKSIKACRSRLPEARAARALKRKITAGYRDLEKLAGEISTMDALSIEGALAKIELGLNVQGPFDWRDHALELAEAGIAELRQLTGAVSPVLPQMSAVRESIEHRS